MDDTCAVCAESLEWVAYGPCGHREVCSTCVSRLRFICEDRRCCICKTESNVVFITKALGDYTTNISDFEVFPKEAREGKNGSYWYHEDTGAFFDDSDQYKMVKAMCRLSCSVCDKAEEQGGQGQDGSKRKPRYRNIEQLRNHLFHRHKLFMCSLCLEGRKIFLCEQNLYTRAQLNQHIHTGDSEVDGSESNRGGFMGHPMCEFCRKPFYGDNELYSHMSTEHYTCHICQRQHPGQFEYYKNYDDLEMHFRSLHFLCENEACLAKKFIVFTSESEMKKHNALEHGGNMSRSKRNAVLQIPTSFRYRRHNEQDNRRGRGRGFNPDSSGNQLSLAIQASLDTQASDNTNHDPSSSGYSVHSQRQRGEIDEIVSPFESLATTDFEASSRYLQAVGQGSANAPLEEASFPLLPAAPPSAQQMPSNGGSGKNTMAARLRRHNNGFVNVLNSTRSWSAPNHGLASSSNMQSQPRAAVSHGHVAPAASSSLNKATFSNGPISSAQARTTLNHGHVSSSISASSPAPMAENSNGPNSSSNTGSAQARSTPNHALLSSFPALSSGPLSSSYASTAQVRPATSQVHTTVSSGSSSWNNSSGSTVNDSISFPSLGSVSSSTSAFSHVSTKNKSKLPSSSKLKVENVQTANKSLVERIQSALEFDEDKYSAFKEISGEYRQGVIGTGEYLSYVQQFGLSHLVLELARLCPDPQKQRELLETYNASVRSGGARENGLSISGVRPKESKDPNKGKVNMDVSNSSSKNKLPEKSSKDTLPDNIIGAVKKLQARNTSFEEDVEVLSKDGYRNSNGYARTTIPEEHLEPSSSNSKLSKLNGSNDVGTGSSASSDGGGGSKQRKKTSKFHRTRLGDGYNEQSDVVDQEDAKSKVNTSDGLPVRGAWHNGGGQKLVALTHK